MNSAVAPAAASTPAAIPKASFDWKPVALLVGLMVAAIQTSILLISSGTRTIGPMIIFLEEGGASTLAAAVGCLMILGVLALMLLSTALARFLPKGVLPWQF